MPPDSQPHRRGRIALVAGLLVLVGFATAVKYTRHHIWPRRFVEIVPGRLYRSGHLERHPLQRVAEEHRLKTILVLLNDEPDSPDQQQEERIAQEKGVEVIRIGMPGDGVAEFDLIERAADIMADESRRPLLVHCWAGVNRTGAACAAWRMKYCGWDFERAMAEARECGYSHRDNPELTEHLQRFQAERIAGSRPEGGSPVPSAAQ